MLEDGEVLRIDLSRPSADHVTSQVVGVVWHIADSWQFASQIDGSSLPVVSGERYNPNDFSQYPRLQENYRRVQVWGCFR